MRLIDADSLKIKVEAMVEHRMIESDYDFGRNQASDYVADILIDDAPTIDAVEVVRCKDCKWAKKAILDEYCVKCTMMHTFFAKHGYCHHGERREP